MDHSETTHNLRDLTVLDRVFLHGDVVASVSDPTGQVGVVEDVNMSVDLLASNGSIIQDISSRDLKRVRDFTTGDYVVLGPWLGRVDDVLDDVTVLFDDGSMCKVMKADPLMLKPVSKSLIEDGHFPYYPGQRVWASSSSVFKNARWLSGLWKASRREGVVTKVTVGSVFIYWIASAGYGPESATTPAEEQSPKNLRLLSCFAHAKWQVGDWCFLLSPAVSSAILCNKSSSRGISNYSMSGDVESEHGIDCVPLKQLDESNPSCQNIEAMYFDAVRDIDGHTENLESNIKLESRSCSSSLSVSKEPVHENKPVHRKKLRKVSLRRDKKARKKDENFERALLIINTRTTVNVVWQDGKRQLGLVSTTLIPIENPGDQEFVAEQYVVEKSTEDDDDTRAVRRVGVVKSVNAKERTACVRWLKQVSRPEDPREFDKEEVVSVYELERHPDYDYCFGDVVVRLTPVSISAHKDGAVVLVDETNKQEDSSEPQWERNPQCEKFDDASNTLNVGPQAIYVVGRDDDEESLGSGSEIGDDDAASWETFNEDEFNAVVNAEEEASSQNSNSVITGEETTPDSEEINVSHNGPLSFPLAALGFVTRLATGFLSLRRKQIDPLISDYSSGNESQSPGSVGSIDALERRESHVEPTSWESSAVDSNSAEVCRGDEEQELETSSRARSDELDSHYMMQSSGSNSCTFKHFDTAKDPLDHFYLGANIQNNSGRKWLKKVQQDWTILQKNLPDSIYVRVYEDRMDLLRAVIVGAYGTPYQDGLFVFDFHLPPEYPQVPPDFEELIKDHFRRRGYYILNACDAYMKGYLIGSLTKDASLSDKSTAKSTSVGFKLMLAKIMPKLITALSDVGADVHQFKHLQQ
ncbi:hypothetical protein IFM89_001893 [Coptis chinensis]|uniref:UBC core domain-containing protein n=1 Tax=Coptis chinensis TaxID=261450 RepID=A0A835IL65_9MAGN|nr:hypothetical protein IFM89_001893 [Coptis chinensis]